ncbi:MAG: tail fiber domain-containing protein [Bacteroidota bacterium]
MSTPSLVSSILVDSDGNVGIMETSPARSLHVGDVMRLEPTSAPATGAEGDLYMDASANELKYHNGTSWISIEDDNQDLSLSSNTLSLTNDATTVDLSGYLDNTDAQDLSLSSNTLSLTNDATTVDLSGYLDNTDVQDLSLSSNTLSLTNDATTVDLSGYLDNTDTQDLSLSSNTLSLTNDATPVDLSTLKFDILEDADGDTKIQLEENTDEDIIRFDTHGTERMVIDSAGNVGIGITTPGTKLDVSGTAKADTLTDGYITMNAAQINRSGSVVELQYGLSGSNEGVRIFGTTGNDIWFQASTGNVGIGTASPGYKLDIASGDVTAVRIGPNSTYSRSLLLGGWGTGTTEAWVRTSDGNLHLDSKSGTHTYVNHYSNGSVFLASGGGNVGIGTASPTAILSVYGAANKPGGGSWAVFSDARSKENVENYSKGLDELLQLRPVSYNYKEEFEWGTDTYVGLIAQEIEKIVPTMVTSKEIKGITDFKEVDSSELLYILVNSVKEQQKQIENLKGQNSTLLLRLKKLEAIIENIK